ncbi:hypothetical protein L1049_006165 [Liquidambar formosana]|uniref:Uncharacterized protein n=1 Tax=Liquidambar formosana TaxID=63359 RepID=A0AAP0RFH7_LIQFO
MSSDVSKAILWGDSEEMVSEREEEKDLGNLEVVVDSLDDYDNNLESDYFESSISNTEFDMDDQEKDDIIEAVGLDGFFAEMDGSSPSSLVLKVRSLVKT